MARRNPPEIGGLHSLKVDNISFRTTQEDMKRLFDKYGEIGDIHIPRDRYTRASKGFAFIRFYSRRDAEYALERVDGRWVDGRELRVAFARYSRPIDDSGTYIRDPRDRGRAGREGGGGRRRSRSRSRSRSPRRRTRSRSRGSRSASRSKSRSVDRKSRSRSASVDDKKGIKKENGKESRSRSRSKSPDRKRKAESRSRSRSGSIKSEKDD